MDSTTTPLFKSRRARCLIWIISTTIGFGGMSYAALELLLPALRLSEPSDTAFGIYLIGGCLFGIAAWFGAPSESTPSSGPTEGKSFSALLGELAGDLVNLMAAVSCMAAFLLSMLKSFNLAHDPIEWTTLLICLGVALFFLFAAGFTAHSPNRHRLFVLRTALACALVMLAFIALPRLFLAH